MNKAPSQDSAVNNLFTRPSSKTAHVALALYLCALGVFCHDEIEFGIIELLLKRECTNEEASLIIQAREHMLRNRAHIMKLFAEDHEHPDLPLLTVKADEIPFFCYTYDSSTIFGYYLNGELTFNTSIMQSPTETYGTVAHEFAHVELEGTEYNRHDLIYPFEWANEKYVQSTNFILVR